MRTHIQFSNIYKYVFEKYEFLTNFKQSEKKQWVYTRVGMGELQSVLVFSGCTTNLPIFPPLFILTSFFFNCSSNICIGPQTTTEKAVPFKGPRGLG